MWYGPLEFLSGKSLGTPPIRHTPMSTTNIIEIQPTELPDEIIKAIAEGKLCHYALELFKRVEELEEALYMSKLG